MINPAALYFVATSEGKAGEGTTGEGKAGTARQEAPRAPQEQAAADAGWPRLRLAVTTIGGLLLVLGGIVAFG